MTEGVVEGGADGVAVRVAGLCLASTGRLSDRLICGSAVRIGLMLDLALAGRVEQTDESIVIDPTPTGFDPADRLLAAIGVEPERSLVGWFDEQRIGLRDVAAAAVAAGRWMERRGPFGLGRRYTVLAPDRTDTDLHRSPDDDPVGWSPADASVCAVAAAAGLLDRELGYAELPSPEVLAATGGVAWLCEAAVEHLRALGSRYAAESAGLGPF